MPRRYFRARWPGKLFAVVVLMAFGLFALAYVEATSTPIVRRVKIALPDWPAGVPAIRAMLISDIHVAGPDMPPSRLRRIVAQVNEIAPDVVLIAGDLVSEKRLASRFYSMAEAVAPLARLRSRLGTFAVLGNHDHWSDREGARAALAAAGVRLLENDAAAVGPLAIGGLDDDFTGHDNLPLTLSRLRAVAGARVLLSHSPDPFPEVPAGVRLMLAGHTHCGQIAPWPIGPVSNMSRYGERYACGLAQEEGKILIVSAGLGTSILPLRLGAPPDMWLLTLGGR